MSLWSDLVPGYDAYSVNDVRLLSMALRSVLIPGNDGYSVSDVRLLTMALWSVLVPGVAAECTPREVNQLFTCIIPHIVQFLTAYGGSTVCDRSLISSDLCK